MKVAITHDYLNQYGGAERVLEAFLVLFPEADVYTLLYEPGIGKGNFEKFVKRTSFLDIPLVRKFHRPFIPIMPLAARSIKLRDDYDLVISLTAGFAKGMRVPKNVYHIMYCHTPLRYAWEYKLYFSNPLFTTIASPAFEYLRRWDYKTAQIPQVILANSGYIAEKIRRYYKRDAKIVYPPIHEKSFFYNPKIIEETPPFFLAVGRLLHYKKFEFLINCFRNTDQKLVIVGTGIYGTSLKALARSYKNIIFLDSVTDHELRELYATCKAFLFPQVEDFGLVAAEAQSCGAPIIAFFKGGSQEIVRENETGVFFKEYSLGAFWNAVERLKGITLSREAISTHAKRFSFNEFKKGIQDVIPKELL